MDAGREARPRLASVLAKATWNQHYVQIPTFDRLSLKDISSSFDYGLGHRAQPPEYGPHFLGDGGCISVVPTLLQRMRLRQEAWISPCRSSVHKHQDGFTSTKMQATWIQLFVQVQPSLGGGKQRRANLGSMLPRRIHNWLCSEALVGATPRILEAAWFHALLEVAGLQFGEPA